MPLLHWLAPAAGALLVVILGRWLAAQASARMAAKAAPIIDLADNEQRPPHP
jgi:hypothetical protein